MKGPKPRPRPAARSDMPGRRKGAVARSPVEERAARRLTWVEEVGEREGGCSCAGSCGRAGEGSADGIADGRPEAAAEAGEEAGAEARGERVVAKGERGKVAFTCATRTQCTQSQPCTVEVGCL